MALLDEVLMRNPPFVVYKMKEALWCTRLLPNGKQCRRETTIALAVEETDHVVVFPLCPQHLPSWAKELKTQEKPLGTGIKRKVPSKKEKHSKKSSRKRKM